MAVPFPPLKVLIAGAGIAGPAAAFWLSKLGCVVTIIERAPRLRASGQQVDLVGQGIVMMRLMGIEAQVRAARVKELGMRMLDCGGRSVAFFPAGGSASPTMELEVMRGDLVGALVDATKMLEGGPEYVFGESIRGVVQDEEGDGDGEGKVHVTFADGRTVDYDLLIGADGFNSSTRQMIQNPDALSPVHDLGLHLAYFTAPSLQDDSKDWTVCHIPGGKCLMTRKDSPENIRVYIATRVGRESLTAARTLPELKAAVAKLLDGVEGCQAERFRRDLLESKEADDLYCQNVSQIRLPEGAWSRGRVVLLGDAAYCVGPTGGGVGTGASLVGAYVLAGEIEKQIKKRENGGRLSIKEASGEYERIVRAFVGQKSYGPKFFARLWLPETRVGIWIVHKVAGFAAALSKSRDSKAVEDKPEELEFPDYFGLIKTVETQE